MAHRPKKHMARHRFDIINALSFGPDDEKQAARKRLKQMSDTWSKREMRPGPFHIPNGKPVMAYRNDARG